MAEEILDVMPSKLKNVSMSVELAIKRELAYRKKVARLSELYGGSMDGLKPLELLSPNPNPNPNPNPCPSKKRPQPEAMTSSPHSQPKPSPSPSPSPTQAPSSGPPRRLPFSNANPSASTQYQRSSLHLLGSGSKRKEPSSGVKWSPSTEEQEDQLYSSNETGKYLFCEICQVHCSGDLNMKQHLDGQKHKAKLILAEHDRAEISNEIETKRWNCEVCKIYCTGEDSFKLHLRGKKHITSLLYF